MKTKRPCAWCGADITPTGGMMVEDGSFYCHEHHFKEYMDARFGHTNWRESPLADGEEENEAGGYYDIRHVTLIDEAGCHGEWEPTGIFYTNWD